MKLLRNQSPMLWILKSLKPQPPTYHNYSVSAISELLRVHCWVSLTSLMTLISTNIIESSTLFRCNHLWPNLVWWTMWVKLLGSWISLVIWPAHSKNRPISVHKKTQSTDPKQVYFLNSTSNLYTLSLLQTFSMFMCLKLIQLFLFAIRNKHKYCLKAYLKVKS
jgi:hypothetical protein